MLTHLSLLLLENECLRCEKPAKFLHLGTSRNRMWGEEIKCRKLCHMRKCAVKKTEIIKFGSRESRCRASTQRLFAQLRRWGEPLRNDLFALILVADAVCFVFHLLHWFDSFFIFHETVFFSIGAGCWTSPLLWFKMLGYSLWECEIVELPHTALRGNGQCSSLPFIIAPLGMKTIYLEITQNCFVALKSIQNRSFGSWYTSITCAQIVY